MANRAEAEEKGGGEVLYTHNFSAPLYWWKGGGVEEELLIRLGLICFFIVKKYPLLEDFVF